MVARTVNKLKILITSRRVIHSAISITAVMVSALLSLSPFVQNMSGEGLRHENGM
jgi:hypothetical protein